MNQFVGIYLSLPNLLLLNRHKYSSLIIGLQNILIMDIEKNLTSTYDQEAILSGFFTLKGVTTELFIYETHFAFATDRISKVIHFDANLLFQIIYQNNQCRGIRFFAQQQYQFIHEKWSQSDLWENLLLRKIKQKNFHQYYRPIKKIGKGNFASVYLAHDKKRDLLVAVKAFVKQVAFKNSGKKALDNQINLLRKLDSPNIMKLYGVYQTDNSLYLITQYIEGLTLENFLKSNKGKLTLKTRKNIIRGLLKGLNEMQKKGVLHRDLKPQNILISKDGQTIKIVDFGLATETDLDQYIFVRCGTPGYVAPQILRIRDNEKPNLQAISDVFSLGSIFYQMIFQKRLFDAYEHEDVLVQNRTCMINLTQDMKGSISFDEADLLQKMLSVNPKNRISSSQALEHPYITEKSVNMFGSMRNRINKPIYAKPTKKERISIENHQNMRIYKSLNK